MNLRKAAQQVLEAIDYLDSHPEGGIDEAETAIEALRAALAQPEPALLKDCREYASAEGSCVNQSYFKATPVEAAPTEPAPGWCKHCQQYTIDEPLPAVKPDVPAANFGNMEPVAWIYKPNRELLWPYEVEATNPIGIDEYLPLYTHPPRTALTDAEIAAAYQKYCTAGRIGFADAVRELIGGPRNE